MHVLCLFVLVCSSSWIQLSVTRYVHCSAVVVNSDILPTFGIIKDIVMDSFYSLWKFYTQFVFPHNHAHEVSMNILPLYELVKSSDLYMIILF